MVERVYETNVLRGSVLECKNHFLHIKKDVHKKVVICVHFIHLTMILFLATMGVGITGCSFSLKVVDTPPDTQPIDVSLNTEVPVDFSAVRVKLNSNSANGYSYKIGPSETTDCSSTDNYYNITSDKNTLSLGPFYGPDQDYKLCAKSYFTNRKAITFSNIVEKVISKKSNYFLVTSDGENYDVQNDTELKYFNIYLSAAQNYDVHVHYDVYGDATLGVDHSMQAGSVTIPSGQSQFHLPVKILSAETAARTRSKNLRIALSYVEEDLGRIAYPSSTVFQLLPSSAVTQKKVVEAIFPTGNNPYQFNSYNTYNNIGTGPAVTGCWLYDDGELKCLFRTYKKEELSASLLTDWLNWLLLLPTLNKSATYLFKTVESSGASHVKSFGSSYCYLNSSNNLLCFGTSRSADDALLGQGGSSLGSSSDIIAAPYLASNQDILDFQRSYFSINIESGDTQTTSNSKTVCLLTNSGAVLCGGGNNFNQIGLSSNSQTNFSTMINSNANQLYMGDGSVCALMTNQTLKCWGYGITSGLGSASTYSVPTTVNLPANVSLFKKFSNYSCALLVTGALYCWGINGNFQLGDGTNLDRNTPVLVIATGVSDFDDLCAIKSNSDLVCWGSFSSDSINHTPQVLATNIIKYGKGYAIKTDGSLIGVSLGGLITTIIKSGISQLPKYASSTLGVNIKSYNQYSACIIDNTQSLICWRNNLNPTPVTLSSNNVSDFYINYYVLNTYNGNSYSVYPYQSLCIIDTSGMFKCLGDFSELIASRDDSDYEYTSADQVIQFRKSNESFHDGVRTCYQDENNYYFCRGNVNQSSRIVYDQNNDERSPASLSSVLVSKVKGKKIKFADEETSSQFCVLGLDDALYCSGFDFSSTLGIDSAFPVKVDVRVTNTPTKDFFVAQDKICTLSESGTLSCYGRYPGNGTQYASQFIELDLSEVQDVRMSYAHTCALLADSSVKCWGQNTGSSGGTSYFPIDYFTSKVKKFISQFSTCVELESNNRYCWKDRGIASIDSNFVSSNTAVKQLEVGPITCALLTSNGTLKCFGDNSSLILSPLSSVTQVSPAASVTIATGVDQFIFSKSQTDASEMSLCYRTISGSWYCRGHNKNHLFNPNPSGVSSLTRTFTQVPGVNL